MTQHRKQRSPAATERRRKRIESTWPAELAAQVARGRAETQAVNEMKDVAYVKSHGGPVALRELGKIRPPECHASH